MMYEYAPKLKKLREKIWMSVCLFFGVLLYGFGQILPYPILYQLISVLLLTAAVLITVRYLLRDYIYRVTVKEDGSADFTITEVMGKRKTVVCRISVGEIQEITPLLGLSPKEISQKCGKAVLYRYVSQWKPSSPYLLEIFDDEKSYFLEISADQGLVDLLLDLKKQYLSDKQPPMT